MNSVIFGDKLTLLYPDGFHIMGSTEKGNMQFFGDSEGECLSDPERHMLISVGKKSIGSISALLLSANDEAKKTEKIIRKPMSSYGYQLDGFTSRKIGAEKAEGFCYNYESQGIGMYGESYVVKYDRTFYYLNLYARRELKSENLDVWGGNPLICKVGVGWSKRVRLIIKEKRVK